MRILFTALYLFGVTSLGAQAPCNCAANFETYKQHITNNYAGFADKVNATTQAQYHQLVKDVHAEALRVTSAEACYSLLERYRSFFRDQHLLLFTDLNIPVSLPFHLQNGKIQESAQHPAALRRYLQEPKRMRKPLEGIWEWEGTEVAIVYQPRQGLYQGVVLQSADPARKPGSILFISKPLWQQEFETYFQEPSLKWERTHSETEQDVLVHQYYGIWRKKYPVPATSLPDEAILPRFGDIRMQLLDSTTLYIRINSCNLANKPLLEQLLRQFEPRLAKIPDWIIDLRTNTGGSTALFAPIEPYLYTHPFIGKGDSYWATPAHTASLDGFLHKYEQELPDAARRSLRNRVVFGQAHPNRWLQETGDTVYYNQVYPSPKRIAILSSKENASAGESFLITAKGMSSKVTIFGTPSAGLLDYGDIADFKLPCSHYTIKIPSRRANYINEGIFYDATGFPPDVRIPAGVTDWIGFVRRYWALKKPLPDRKYPPKPAR